MKIALTISLAAALLFGAGAASAHHSGAMFDDTKLTQYEGVVKELQWTNPHMWLEVFVPNTAGKQTQWGFEMIGTNVMYRQGWRKDTVKPGDKVTVWAHPLKDGRPGGSYVAIKLPDGKTLGCQISDGTRCVRKGAPTG